MKDIVTLEFSAHRRRMALTREGGWVCTCGGWKGFKTADYNRHVIDAISDAVGAHMVKRLEQWSPRHHTPSVSNHYLGGFESAVERLRKIAEGCTCRPGMVGHWGCPVDDQELD